MVVDNANHADVLFSQDGLESHATATSISPLRPLAYFLPRVSNGSLLVTSRDQNVARRLRSVNSRNTTVKVGPITSDEVMTISGNRIGPVIPRDRTSQVLEVLHAMPLAITQASTFMSQMTGTDSTYMHADPRSASSHPLARRHTDHQIIATGLIHEDIGVDLADVVHRLTTAVEDLYRILPAVREIQSGQHVPNIPSLLDSPTHHTSAPEHYPTRSDTQHDHSSLPTNYTDANPGMSTSSTQQTMAVSVVAGTNGLLQLGLSISDLALSIDQGKKFGNFVRAGQNDDDLFDGLGEDREAVLKRRGLLDSREMEESWPMIQFVHQGVKTKGKILQSSKTGLYVRDANRRIKMTTLNGVDNFTWVMVAITSALDECLPSSEIQELLIHVFVEVLDRDDDIVPTLGVTMKRNIESWRSFGRAREIAFAIKKEMRKSPSNGTSDQSLACAIPQLNEAETENTRKMLTWLLNGDATVFNAMSPITFSIAEALKRVKLDLCTDGNIAHERQAYVRYHHGCRPLRASSFSNTSIPRGLGSRPLRISWPRDKPESMIDALGVGRLLENLMKQSWQRGKIAAGTMELSGQADGPYEATEEVYYILQVSDDAYVSKKYEPHIGMLADQGLPADTESTYSALEWILQGEPPDCSRWLHNHVAQDYLLRVDNIDTAPEERYKPVYLKYQAFVFGFYYRLLTQLLSFQLIEATAFFQGIWGANSTTFLAMCTQLGRCWRRDEKVSRAHMLYILSSMYNGRRKIFDATSKLPRLVGVLGPISVLTLPLVRTTDDPREISRIAIVDLPIVDLSAEGTDGDLMASEGGGIHFESPGKDDRPTTITQPAGPTDKWTVHPRMSMILGGDGTSGVVMAARCGKRLVGWFNPLAADISFLSPAYVRESYSEGDVVAFEVKDEHWQAGKVLQPSLSNQGSAFGVVRSHNSPSLRYAAAGFYAERGEEIAIARSATEFRGAFDRIEAQDRGMIIA